MRLTPRYQSVRSSYMLFIDVFFSLSPKKKRYSHFLTFYLFTYLVFAAADGRNEGAFPFFFSFINQDKKM